MIISGDINHLSTNERVAVNKMQISFHLLHIETGRYKKLSRDERFCPSSDSSTIGDQFHYLMIENSLSFSLLSSIVWIRNLSINSYFMNITCKALFCIFWL